MSSSLPPLEWLRVFEAAARLGAFTAAANELGLTQAAVSQRIRNLEAELGAALFVRLPRGVEMTTEGEAYAPHVHAALSALSRSTVDLFGRARRHVSVAAPVSVIERWIAPRLPALQAIRPDLQITVTTVHRAADYGTLDTDLDVRFGTGEWPERSGRKLFNEVLAPVAAPGLARDEPDWRRLPILSVAGPRAGWRDWANGCGVAPPPTPVARFESQVQGISAASAGAGVLLASLALIDTELTSDMLVRLDEPSLRMEAGYWLTWPASEPDSKERRLAIETFCDA